MLPLFCGNFYLGSPITGRWPRTSPPSGGRARCLIILPSIWLAVTKIHCSREWWLLTPSNPVTANRSGWNCVSLRKSPCPPSEGETSRTFPQRYSSTVAFCCLNTGCRFLPKSNPIPPRENISTTTRTTEERLAGLFESRDGLW